MSASVWKRLPSPIRTSRFLNLVITMEDVEKIRFLRKSGLLPEQIKRHYVSNGKDISTKDVYMALGFNV